MIADLILVSLDDGLLSGLPDAVRLALARLIARIARESASAQEFLLLSNKLERDEVQLRQVLSKRVESLVGEIETQRRELEAITNDVIFKPQPPSSEKPPASHVEGSADTPSEGRRVWRLFAKQEPALSESVAQMAGLEPLYEHFFLTHVLPSDSPIPDEIIRKLASDVVMMVVAETQGAADQPETSEGHARMSDRADQREAAFNAFASALGHDLRGSIDRRDAALRSAVGDIERLGAFAIQKVVVPVVVPAPA